MATFRATRKLKRSRRDGWENIYTGLGLVGKDKRLGSTFCATLVDQPDAEEIWRGDDIAARMVEVVPDEMLRRGFEVTVDDEVEEGNDIDEDPIAGRSDTALPPPGEAPPDRKGGETTSGDPKELAEALEAAHRELNTVEHARKGLYYGRAFGGGGLLLGVDDGQSLEKPLREDRIKSFKWMNLFTPRELWPQSYYADPRKPRYGEVATYRLLPIDIPPGQTVQDFPLVHETRIVRFSGMATSRGAVLRNIMPGWDDSVFVRVLQVINDFQHAWQGAAILTQDFSTPVLKLKNLARMLTSKEGAKGMEERARALEMTRSIARVVIADADNEDYKRETVPVTGLAEILEKLMLRVAAAARMPVSLLMGQSPAGLNATGDSDIRWFYDQIASLQERQLLPVLKRITRLLLLSKDGPSKGVEPDNWSIRFPTLWQLTEKEQAEARFTQAQADNLYIQAQVVTPQEIARSRFGGDAYSYETRIDTDIRDELDNPDDTAVQLGAGAAEDKQKEQELKVKALEKPAPAGPAGTPQAAMPPKD